jgi:hypothetical protein
MSNLYDQYKLVERKISQKNSEYSAWNEGQLARNFFSGPVKN